jgi:hypothetical protein
MIYLTLNKIKILNMRTGESGVRVSLILKTNFFVCIRFQFEAARLERP